MKRALLIPLIVLLLASMACSLTGTKATPTPEEPAQAVVAPEKATVPPEPVKAPTDTEAAPAEVAPTEEPATEAPTLTEAPTEMKDAFDRETGKWSDPLVVTSQASGRDAYVKITSGTGVLRFAVQDKETYIYKFYSEEVSGADTIEVDFQNKGAFNTGIALVCKVNEDRTSWYEVRVSAADNNYNFFLYDKQRKIEQDKNPYVLLGKGHMKIDQYYPTKPNRVILTCSDTELSIDVNKGKVKASQTLDTQLEGTAFGIGIMTADVLPGTIDFDTVTIR